VKVVDVCCFGDAKGVEDHDTDVRRQGCNVGCEAVEMVLVVALL
jgi:hypothetical protein